MFIEKYYAIAYVVIVGSISSVCTLQAGPMADAVTKNKKQLQSQLGDLPKIGDQLLATGSMLQFQLIGGINKAEAQLRAQAKQLVVPQSIFNDPFGELARLAPSDEFIKFMRNPQFRGSYNRLWSDILRPFGAGSLPDILNNLTKLLNLTQSRLTNIKGKFTPIVLDLSPYTPKPVSFDFVANNINSVRSGYAKMTGGKKFDPQGIYSGLSSALKDFERALAELDKLERFFKALNI